MHLPWLAFLPSYCAIKKKKQKKNSTTKQSKLKKNKTTSSHQLTRNVEEGHDHASFRGSVRGSASIRTLVRTSVRTRVRTSVPTSVRTSVVLGNACALLPSVNHNRAIVGLRLFNHSVRQLLMTF